jgi:hypothetical protein
MGTMTVLKPSTVLDWRREPQDDRERAIRAHVLEEGIKSPLYLEIRLMGAAREGELASDALHYYKKARALAEQERLTEEMDTIAKAEAAISGARSEEKANVTRPAVSEGPEAILESGISRATARRWRAKVMALVGHLSMENPMCRAFYPILDALKIVADGKCEEVG